MRACIVNLIIASMPHQQHQLQQQQQQQRLSASVPIAHRAAFTSVSSSSLIAAF